MPRTLIQVVAAVLVAFTFMATPASAQATRTWVSGVGDDANPCSRTAPCKTFAGAISKTATGGEINVLDSGGFGGVTITKAITIRADGATAGVLVAGTNGITINAPTTARVVLEGLDFEGLNQATTSGINGVSISAAGQVIIIDCTIRGFQVGINVLSTGTSDLTIDRSTIIGNSQYGLSLSDATGLGRAWVTRTLLAGNELGQIRINGNKNLVVLSDVIFTGRGAPSFLVENGGKVLSFGNNSFLDVPPTGYTLTSQH
ncbi:hypothetical protein FSZ31_09045 [Sphingorhabdus soli]|uniref:Right handed beta helix domain-containing protein n=1 Tax=Flavisphingopyxis soli TaxID=2601267 RepID=A0A5C6U8A5_9SPHN|nr:right-handed parallel beta-helix repeat-containing protein [Sphingorhabdus soli]TXC69069.1 hypothetical protein FSZ31_09045 [Sphingorhabdus soli]